MDLWDVLRVLVKRWYVALPLVLATAGAAVQAGQDPETRYSAQASYLLLLPAPTPGDLTSGVNPYLQLSAPAGFAGVLSARVSDPEAAASVRVGGDTTAYSFAQERNSPVLSIFVEALDPEAARLTVLNVAQRLDETAAELQDEVGIPAGQQVTGQVLTPPVVTELTASAARLQAAIVAGGLLIAVLAAFAVEGAVGARRRSAALDRQRPVARRARDEQGGQAELLDPDPLPAAAPVKPTSSVPAAFARRDDHRRDGDLDDSSALDRDEQPAPSPPRP